MKIVLRDDGSLLVDGENNTIITRTYDEEAFTINVKNNMIEIRNFIILYKKDEIMNERPPTIIMSELDPYGEEDWSL